MPVMMYYNFVIYEDFWYYLFNSPVNEGVLALIILREITLNLERRIEYY